MGKEVIETSPVNCLIDKSVKTRVLCLLPLEDDLDMTILIEQLLDEWATKKEKNKK